MSERLEKERNSLQREIQVLRQERDALWTELHYLKQDMETRARIVSDEKESLSSALADAEQEKAELVEVLQVIRSQIEDGEFPITCRWADAILAKHEDQS